MPRTVTAAHSLVDVHARIPREQYDRMLAECGHCACTFSSFLRTAINREIGARKQQRQKLAQETILEGQMSLEAITDAD